MTLKIQLTQQCRLHLFGIHNFLRGDGSSELKCTLLKILFLASFSSVTLDKYLKLIMSQFTHLHITDFLSALGKIKYVNALLWPLEKNRSQLKKKKKVSNPQPHCVSWGRTMDSPRLRQSSPIDKHMLSPHSSLLVLGSPV